MDTYKQTLGEVFGEPVRWLVPIYQRPYVWKSKDNDQIPGMWEDWCKKTERLLKYKEASPHYFGAIIYSDKKKGPSEIDKRDLVDGQQRLTTFQIALAALRDAAKILKYKNTDDIESYILNKKDDKILPDEEGYKLLPSRHDRDVFCKIVFPNEDRYPAEHELTKAYNYFCKYIKKFVDDRKDEEEVETLIDTLKDALLNYFRVVTIQLGKDDDPQQIFASLNGQAEPLSPFDLIRNDIFYRSRGSDDEIPATFEKAWDYFYDPFWTKKVGQALITKARVDHFIIDVVIAQVADEVHKHRIATAYKHYATNPPLDSFKELDILKRYGKSYRALQEKNGEASNRIAKMLDSWGLSTMNPLVLWIDTRENEILSLDDKRKLFSMIESYVVRREICKLTTKAFNKTVPAILAKMKNQEDNIIGVLKDFLETETSDSTKMPTDEDVLWGCRNQPFYKNLSSLKRIYIMQCIQADLADTPYGENPTQKKLSIEHIMPQKWSTHWALQNGEKVSHENYSNEKNLNLNLDVSFQILMEERKNAIETIGNLTLVTPKFNSKLKNKDWQTKRAEIIDNSQIEINHEIVKKDEWNEDTIKNRSAELAKRINKIWQSS